MVIDVHAHVTAPDALYVYKSGLLSHRGSHGRGKVDVSDDEIRRALNTPIFGGSSHLEQLREVGTDLQFVSPRPYQMMHSEKPEKLVHWYIEENNNIIARQVQLYPNTFRGIAGLPQSPGAPIAKCLPELERCVTELRFLGCLINPDPGECTGHETPPLGHEYWHPLYEKLVELDVVGYIHGAGCRSERLTYSLHFINEESIAVLSLLTSDVFTRYPTLKLVVSHGGGAIPYHLGRFEASSLRRRPERFSVSMRRLYYDTVLYSREALDLLVRTVGPDRCVFGTERPGIGTVKDPATGRWMDDTRHHIESFEWLSDDDKARIFEGNARRLFKIDVGVTA